jgi:hypothetical protein
MTTWLTRCFALLLLVLPFVPVVADDPADAEISRLVKQLGSDVFIDREAARKRLYEIGAPAVDALQKAMINSDLETRRRAEELLLAIDTPQIQAVTEALFADMSKKDWKAAYRCFTAEGQELAVVHLISVTQFVVPIGTKKEKDLQMLLKKHGFDVAKMLAEDEDAFKKGQKPRDSRNDVKHCADQIKNKEAFFAELLTWMDKNFAAGEEDAPVQKQTPPEAIKKDREPPDPRTVLKDLKIKGNTASAKLNQQWSVEFRRVNGRWLFDLTNYGGVNGIFLMRYLAGLHGWF